jgi:hypothetical protein
LSYRIESGSGINHFGSGSGESGSGIGIGSGKCETEQERLLCKYGIACHFMKHFLGLITWPYIKRFNVRRKQLIWRKITVWISSMRQKSGKEGSFRPLGSWGGA